MSFSNLILVFLGGGLGSVLRFFLSKTVNLFLPLSLPFATLFSNLFSVGVLSLVYLISQLKNTEHENIRLLIMVGFCGGLSTFSTFSMETAELFRRGETWWAVSNIVFSNLACISIMLLAMKNMPNG